MQTRWASLRGELWFVLVGAAVVIALALGVELALGNKVGPVDIIPAAAIIVIALTGWWYRKGRTEP